MFSVRVAGETIGELKKNLLRYHDSLIDSEQDTVAVKKLNKKLMYGHEGSAAPIESKPAPTLNEAFITPAVNVLEKAVFKFDISPEITEQDGGATETNLGPDTRGIPWDDRIHSASKKKNKDGTWRSKKGVDPFVVTNIESQIKQTITIPAAASPLPTTEVAATQHVTMPMPTTSVKVESPITVQAPVRPAATGAAAEQKPAYAESEKPALTYVMFKENIVQIFHDLMKAKKFDQKWCNELLENFGAKEVWKLAEDDSKCRQVYQGFGSYCFITCMD